jgi:hypothetical protein
VGKVTLLHHSSHYLAQSTELIWNGSYVSWFSDIALLFADNVYECARLAHLLFLTQVDSFFYCTVNSSHIIFSSVLLWRLLYGLLLQMLIKAWMVPRSNQPIRGKKVCQKFLSYALNTSRPWVCGFYIHLWKPDTNNYSLSYYPENDNGVNSPLLDLLFCSARYAMPDLRWNSKL